MEHKADCRNELYSWFNIQFSFYYIFYHLSVKRVQFPRKSKDTVQDPQAPRSLVENPSLKDKDRPALSLSNTNTKIKKLKNEVKQMGSPSRFCSACSAEQIEE